MNKELVERAYVLTDKLFPVKDILRNMLNLVRDEIILFDKELLASFSLSQEPITFNFQDNLGQYTQVEIDFHSGSLLINIEISKSESGSIVVDDVYSKNIAYEASNATLLFGEIVNEWKAHAPAVLGYLRNSKDDDTSLSHKVTIMSNDTYCVEIFKDLKTGDLRATLSKEFGARYNSDLILESALLTGED